MVKNWRYVSYCNVFLLLTVIDNFLLSKMIFILYFMRIIFSFSYLNFSSQRWYMKPKMCEDNEQQGLLGDDQSPNRGSIVDTLKGIIAAFTTVILHAVGATCVQLLQRRIPDLELNMFRSVAPFLMYSLYFLIKCNWPIIERDKIGITSLYIVTSFTSILFYFVAVSLLPAALVSCVATVSCLVSGLMLFSCVGEERITLKRISFAAICIFGDDNGHSTLARKQIGRS